MITQSLAEIVQRLLNDPSNERKLRQSSAGRERTIPNIQPALHQFIQGEINFTQLSNVLNQTQNRWYTGNNNTPGRFNIDISKFAKYHMKEHTEFDEQFRKILQDLDARTLGQKIEQLYNFLLQERDRLRRTGLNSYSIVSPISSAFIISLFAHWLDPESDLVICTQYVRESTAFMVRQGLLPNNIEFQPRGNDFEIRTAAQYNTFLSLFDAVKDAAPQITSLPRPYWREYFIWWVMDHRQKIFTSDPVLTKENDDSEKLSSSPTQPLRPEGWADANSLLTNDEQEQIDDEAAQRQTLLIMDRPLLPVPEPQLSENIREVRRHILVDESVIRRIYHALLAGHVILTGPPGTGKTELARLIPEILWRIPHLEESDDTSTEAPADDSPTSPTTKTAYTTRLVTATDDWSTRTLISGIVPQNKDGQVTYKIQYGHLTATILKNWSFQSERPEDWSTLSLQRTRVTTTSGLERGSAQTFKGQWLVIDEFNRAPIDLALGDALTALGGLDMLRVGIEGGSAELPIPRDFRLIGTLNSFDRNYLNQISEALKRRFSFVEILPPGRPQRAAEQGIALHKALNSIQHLSDTITTQGNDLAWQSVAIHHNSDGHYSIEWSESGTDFQQAFNAAWRVFEVIRIYRQLGTAQAISLLRHMLISSILQSYTTREQWIGQALDAALCDTIADQLQVLLPDEIETLLLYLTTEPDNFVPAYHEQLSRLTGLPQRLYGQLLSLASVQRESGAPTLTDAEVEHYARAENPAPPAALLGELFHVRPGTATILALPQFTRRLRTFKAERGL